MTVLAGVDAIRCGAAAVDAVYLGSDLVWTALEPTPVASLTIPTGSVNATLTNFVTRVDLADLPASWWAALTQADGREIRVKSDGVEIPFDPVHIDTSRQVGDLFFKHTLGINEQQFTVEVVSGATTPAATDPIGHNAVWSDYDAAFIGGTTDRAGKVSALTLSGGALLSGWEVTAKSPNVTAHQGITLDAAGNRYVIGSNELTKYDADWSVLVSNSDPLGGTGITGATHLSDGVIVGNELFAPFQNDGNTFEYVGVWDTTTLAFKRSYNISAIALDVSSLTYNPADGLFYATKYTATSTTVYKFDSDFAHVGDLTLGSAVSWMQGSVFSAGTLYVTSDMTFISGSIYQWRLYAIDPATGGVTEIWRGCLGDHLEGLTAEANGNLLMLWDGLTDGAAGGVDSYVYTLSPAASAWLNPGTTGYALSADVPQRTAWTIGASGILGVVIGTNVGQGLFSYGISAGSQTTRASLAYYDQTNAGGLWNSTDTWLDYPGGFTAADGSRHRYHHTQNGTTDRKLWADGTLLATDVGVSQRPTATGFMLGAEDTDATQCWRGQINYAYVRNGALSTAWIAAEHDSWENPSSFYTVNAPPTVDAVYDGGTAASTDIDTIDGGTAASTDIDTIDAGAPA